MFRKTSLVDFVAHVPMMMMLSVLQDVVNESYEVRSREQDEIRKLSRSGTVKAKSLKNKFEKMEQLSEEEVQRKIAQERAKRRAMDEEVQEREVKDLHTVSVEFQLPSLFLPIRVTAKIPFYFRTEMHFSLNTLSTCTSFSINTPMFPHPPRYVTIMSGTLWTSITAFPICS